MLYSTCVKHKEFISLRKDKLPKWKINMTWSGKDKIILPICKDSRIVNSSQNEKIVYPFQRIVKQYIWNALWIFIFNTVIPPPGLLRKYSKCA